MTTVSFFSWHVEYEQGLNSRTPIREFSAFRHWSRKAQNTRHQTPVPADTAQSSFLDGRTIDGAPWNPRFRNHRPINLPGRCESPAFQSIPARNLSVGRTGCKSGRFCRIAEQNTRCGLKSARGGERKKRNPFANQRFQSRHQADEVLKSLVAKGSSPPSPPQRISQSWFISAANEIIAFCSRTGSYAAMRQFHASFNERTYCAVSVIGPCRSAPAAGACIPQAPRPVWSA